MIELTKQQRDAVQYSGSAFIEACPGSGKTRTLSAKLLHLLDEVRQTPRRIACITYTNAAVHELENRVGQYEENDNEACFEVSTIHSFCLLNILRPYYWKLPNYRKGIEVLPSDSELYEEYIKSICLRHGLGYKLDVKRSFEQISRDTDGSPIAPYPLNTKPDVVHDFWSQLESSGYVDFANIVYFSYILVSRYPSIAKSVACKFAWILIDEFQDTTALQFEVFKIIAGFNITRFFLVGDPKQSIYGFAGAKPDLMYEFCDSVNANTNFAINKNWRSSHSVVAIAERLLPRPSPMVAVGDQRDFQFLPSHLHCQRPYDGIMEHFLPALMEHDVSYGDTAILAPWWIPLYHLGRNLSNGGIPIVGPGARPYRRNNYLFTRLAERTCEYIVTGETHLIPVLERELFFLVRNLTGQYHYHIFSYWGRRIVIRLIKCVSCITQLDDPAEEWLISAVSCIANILQGEQLISTDHSKLLSQSVHDLIKEIRKNSKTQLHVRDMAVFASYSKSIKLLTFHRAKGLEFDAIALIDMHKGRIPHFSIERASECERIHIFEESKRLFYVGITRARKILMYFTDSSDYRNKPSSLLELV